MDKFIDIHNHILPGVDDGPTSMEEALKMIEIAYKDGIGTIISTSHYHEGRYEKDTKNLQAILNDVKTYIEQVYPDFKLYLGSEVYYSHACLKLLEEKKIPTLAGSKYILVEFSPMSEFSYIKNSIKECLYSGFLPILAHTERYKCLYNNLNLVYELIETGAYIQVNARSVVDRSKRIIYKFANKLLKFNCVHIIATDGHNIDKRSPSISLCTKHIIKKHGQSKLEALLKTNPRKIINHEYI